MDALLLIYLEVFEEVLNEDCVTVIVAVNHCWVQETLWVAYSKTHVVQLQTRVDMLHSFTFWLGNNDGYVHVHLCVYIYMYTIKPQ